MLPSKEESRKAFNNQKRRAARWYGIDVSKPGWLWALTFALAKKKGYIGIKGRAIPYCMVK